MRTEGSKPNFADVKAGAWYTGWINASESLGIFQGDGNGKFRPNDTISNQEVITVQMRMLGYNDNLKGSWPVNYVTEANKQDITEDVSIVASAAAKRGDVVVMLDATLDTELVTYDKDTDEFVQKQRTVGGNEEEGVTLLQDAFDGAATNEVIFTPVTNVRDVAKQELTWNADGKTFVINADTTVSSNAGNIFNLKGHQGKVYYVEDGDKYYAKYIEVDSYVKLVSDPVEKVSDNKVVIGATKYNAADTVLFTKNAGAITTDEDGKEIEPTKTVGGLDFYTKVDADNASKNSKYLLYFDDDDQVYAVASDKDMTDKAYFVESVGSTTIKLIGSEGSENMDNDDDEVLVWTGTEFVTPSTLEVGDAVVLVADDLYELTDAKTGVLKSSTSTQWNIDGTNYKNAGAKKLDADMETADATIEDIYGNTVTYLLNDDNSVSAIVVDETSTGTKLYGVIVNASTDDGKSLTSSDVNTVTIFTEEGTTVEYALDDDEAVSDRVWDYDDLGKLVEYKLNKDGEIKSLKWTDEEDELVEIVTDEAGKETVIEIEVKNNTYLKGNGNTVTLASNVAVFEITQDDGDIDVALVTRAALLAGGDFEPGKVTIDTKDGDHDIEASAAYFLNSNDAVRAIAYTDADTSNYHYGVIDDVWFSNSDYEDGDALVLVGDDTVYEFKNIEDWFTVDEDDKRTNLVDDDYVIIYTISGDSITIEDVYTNEPDTKTDYAKVDGYTDGLITLDKEIEAEVDSVPDVKIQNIMTDANTVVYVIDKHGDVAEGTLDDIDEDDYVYVPVVDDDDYADIVIVSEYGLK